MTTTTYAVTGMSCGHCVNAVTGELSGLGGVSAVTVDLVPGGNSSVTIASEAPLSPDALSAALDEAGGYQISWLPPPPLSADAQPRKRSAEAAGTRLLDKDLQLIRAHLHPLAEIIGDDDPPLLASPPTDQGAWRPCHTRGWCLVLEGKRITREESQ
jgi:copper chaperone CopZ